MTDYKHILVYGEISAGRVSATTRELLGGGRSLADQLGEELIVLFIGNGVAEEAREAFSLGADRVYVADKPEFADFEAGCFAAAAETALQQVGPRYLLFGHTDQGADIGPRIAFRKNLAIATDCVELSVEAETKRLLMTKPVYGGLAMATYSSDDFPQIATVRPKSLTAGDRSERSGEVSFVDIDPVLLPRRVRVLEKVIEEAEGIKLEEAEVIVSGGRGIGDAEGFKALEEAAKFLSAAVGASRVACDNEWVSTTIQVGITGKIVAPRVYVAVGISGASQHMSGCSRSKTIVAINKDPAAAIFKYAHFGVVGDWKAILPAFIAKLKELGG